MNWPLIRDTLAEIVPEMIAADPLNVVWKGTFEEGSRVVGTRVVLSANSIVTAGVDETRLIAEGANDQVVEQVGQRRLTWSMQIEAQNQGPLNTARVLIDQIRIRLRRESIRARLNAAGLSVANFLNTQYRDFVDDGRQISWASMDVLLNSFDSDIDTTPDAGAWIGEAIVDGTVNDGSSHAVHVDVNSR